MITSTLVLLAIFSSGSRASDTAPFCSMSFATLAAAEGERPDLVVTAYRQLFETLGRGRISAAKLREMKEPFELDDDSAGGDLFVLRKKLTELHELVRAKGWDTPGLRLLLREELGRIGDARDGAVQVQRQAVAQGPSHRVLPLKGSRPFVFSPDRQWVLVDHKPSGGGPGGFDVYDVKNDKVTFVPNPSGLVRTPIFSPNGKQLIFAETQKIVAVPFHASEGSLDWAAQKTIILGSDLPTEKLDFHPTNSPNQFFLSGWGQLFLIDLAKGTETRVLTPVRPQPHTVDVGGVPGTNKGFYVIWEEQEYRMYEGPIDSLGNFISPTVVTKWKSDPGAVHFSADRNTLVSSPSMHQRTVILQRRGGDPLSVQQLISGHTKVSGFGGEVQGIVTHPTKSEAFVLVPTLDGLSTRIESFNLETGQAKWVHMVPYHFETKALVTPDGKELWFKSNKDNLISVNLAVIDLMLSE